MVQKSVVVDAYVDIDLDDFSDDELIEEMENRGLNTDKEIDLDRICHLIDCGLVQEARYESWEMIVKYFQSLHIERKQ